MGGNSQSYYKTFVVAGTGEEPELAPQATDKLHQLAVTDEEIDETLIARYHARVDFLHGHCF